MIRLSHSAIAAFLRCPRSWYLDYVAGIRPVGDRPRPLDFGNAFHAGLEGWWTAAGGTVERLADAHARFKAQSEHLSFADRVLGPELLTGYAVTYGDDELRAHSIPLGECKLEVPVLNPDGQPEPGMILVAKLDEIGFTIDGETVLVEHKTTTSNLHSASFWGRFDHSLQVPIYFLAAHDVGRTIDRAIVDVVRAPKLSRLSATPVGKREFYKRVSGTAQPGDPKPGTRLRDETPEEFALRVREMLLDDPGKFYARKEYVMSAQQLTEARLDIWGVGKLMQAMVAAEAAPRNSDGCERFNSLCGYHGYCFGSDDIHDEKLYSVRVR